MSRDLKNLRAYLAEEIAKPTSKKPQVMGVGCALTPVVIGALAYFAFQALGMAGLVGSVLLGLPAYGMILAALDSAIGSPKNSKDRAAVQRKLIIERLRNETRRKVNGDRTLLVLMESCATSLKRIQGALAQPIWVSSEKHWAEWRDKTQSAADAAMREAVDQCAPFLMGAPTGARSKVEEILENLLFEVDETIPADLPQEYSSLYQIARDMKQLAEEVERQTQVLYRQGLGAKAPSSDQIRDVLGHLEEIRRAQNELDDTVGTS